MLADNPLAAALPAGCVDARNLVRLVFLDPDARASSTRTGSGCAASTVAGLRAAVGPDLDDPRLTELVGELSLKSEEFRRLWARHDIREKTHGTKRFRHPLVGELTLGYESFTVNGAPGQMLVVYQAGRAAHRTGAGAALQHGRRGGGDW